MRASTSRLITAGVGVLLLACQSVPGRALETREIIASGEMVPGFGRIGIFGFTMLGIDARGRVLITGAISDGRVGIYWGDGGRLAPAWQTGEPTAEPLILNPYSARTSSNGQIVVLGAVELPSGAIVEGLYVIEGDGVRPIVRTFDRGPGGETFCALALIGSDSSAISDGGAVGFLAETVPPGVDCNSDERTRLWQSIYLFQGGVTTKVVNVGDRAPSGWLFDRIGALGVTADGAVVFQASGVNEEENAIFITANDGLRTVVSDGAVGPRGEPVSGIAALTASPGGSVLFSATEGGVVGLYRTDQGQVLPVALGTWTTPDGYDFWLQQNTQRAISDRGDVALSIEWRGADSRVRIGVIVYPVVGGVELIPDARDALLNAAGDLVFIDGERRAVQKRAATITPIVANGDPAPGGGYFGVQGLSWVNCLSDDGLVTTVAYNGREEEGLVCVDADGPHLVTRAGDPAPGGGNFSAITNCQFVSATEIVFFGYVTEGERNEQSLFRATPAGLEQIVAHGELYRFQVNRRGTIALVDSGVSWEPSIVLLRRGEGEMRLALDTYPQPDGGRVSEVSEMGLADNDSVIAAVTVDPEVGDRRKAIVEVTPDAIRVIATLDIPYPSAFEPRFSSLLVAGDWIAFHTRDNEGNEASWFARVGSAAPPYRVLPNQDVGIHRLTPGGRALVDAGGPFVLDHDTLDPLPMNDWNNFPPGVPEGLNDRGNVLFHSYDAWNGGSREALHLSGDPPTARCFVPPTSEPRPLPTLTPTPSRLPIGTPPPNFDCVANPSACVRIEIGAASGAPGETVPVEVRLDIGPWTVAGVQLDLAFPPGAEIAADANGRPTCTVNGDIHKPATAFAFLPPECASRSECIAVRALVLSLTDVEPIADSAMLFRCDVSIDAGARPAEYPLAATNVGASTPDGSALPALAVDGLLVVRGTSESTIDSNPPVTGAALQGSTGDGCAIAPFSESDMLLGLFSVPLLLLLRRRGRSRA